jgi:hypothetical protein
VIVTGKCKKCAVLLAPPVLVSTHLAEFMQNETDTLWPNLGKFNSKKADPSDSSLTKTN